MMCLVLAMSGTSALLAWGDRQSRRADPGLNPLNLVLSPQQIDGLVQSIVAEAGNFHPARWTSVDVLAGPELVPNSTHLTAEPNRPDFHFRIDRYGRPFASDAWVRQVTLAEKPTGIVIQVARNGAGQPMTPIQWQCVQSLISELSAIRQSRLADRQSQLADQQGRLANALVLPVRLHQTRSDANSAGNVSAQVVPTTTFQLAAIGTDQ